MNWMHTNTRNLLEANVKVPYFTMFFFSALTVLIGWQWHLALKKIVQVISIGFLLEHTHKHTHTQPFYSSLDFVQDNPGEPVPEETFIHSPIMVINHPLSAIMIMASSIFSLCAGPSFSTISVQVFFCLPLGLAPSTSYSIHFFTRSLSSFCITFPYHRNLFCCSTEIMSSIPSLSLNPLLGTLSGSFTPHIHLTILISVRWIATSFSFFTSQISLPCNILLHTQLLYSLPLTISGTAVRKSRIHVRHDYHDFRHVPWFLAIAMISCHDREYWRIICNFSF